MAFVWAKRESKIKVFKAHSSVLQRILTDIVVYCPAPRPKEQDPWMRLEDHPTRNEFLNETFGLLQSDSTSILSYYLLPWVKGETKKSPTKHQNKKSHIGSIIDSAPIGGTGVPVLTDWNCCTNDHTALEDGPED
jgi:hypothetical protein